MTDDHFWVLYALLMLIGLNTGQPDRTKTPLLNWLLAATVAMVTMLLTDRL
jgi:hypothetical protein